MKTIKLKLKSKFKFRLKQKKKKRLMATIIYSKEVAKTYHDVKYYEAMQEDIKKFSLREKIKHEIKTKKKGQLAGFFYEVKKGPENLKVTTFINKMKKLLEERSEGVFNRLYGILKRNREAAIGGFEPPTHGNLLYLISSVPMLVVAYKKIRKNKGATTLGYILSEFDYNNLDPESKSYANKTYSLPDGMNKEIFHTTSKLLRQGKYPWGASRRPLGLARSARIYIPKPGKPDKLRPITIPPFMDRVIQASITMVLQAIYEPWFEKQNCSFGFRPNKGVHDAIYCLTNRNAQGLDKALEADIEAAYDSVCKQKLLNILSKRILDRKFLELIRNRLDYQFFDSLKGEYIKEKKGIPQGGIDSPYLWNIYMYEFDSFVIKETKKLFDYYNYKSRKNKSKFLALRARPKGLPKIKKIIGGRPLGLARSARRASLRNLIKVINKFPQEHEKLNIMFKGKDKANFDGDDGRGYKEILRKTDWQIIYKNKLNTNLIKYKLIKMNKKSNDLFIKIPNTEQGKKLLRFIYVRYADDWILLTNAPLVILKQLKEVYKNFLKEELSATLSEEKSLITNIKQDYAHFLGFEIKTRRSSIIKKVKAFGRTYKQNFYGRVFSLPDRTRLINRLYMKGYCNKKGFPREIPFLSILEPYAIIERYNSVLRGLMNYYTEFVSIPYTCLTRWYYIIKYSCLKTLAQKYKTNITKIFKKYQVRNPKSSKEKDKTIAVNVIHIINGKQYKKTWRLLRFKELIFLARNISRKEKVSDKYWELYKGSIPEKFSIYETDSTNITDQSFLDKIKWVNLRTQASLDSPCCICGSETQVEMHHLKSVRKNKFLLTNEKIWEKTVGILNRKQIPVCKECHIQLIHKGKYGGTKLSYLCPKIMYDNRLITIESNIKLGREKNYAKSLEEKGWKAVN